MLYGLGLVKLKFWCIRSHTRRQKYNVELINMIKKEKEVREVGRRKCRRKQAKSCGRERKTR